MCLKASVPFTAENEEASYNLGGGVVKRNTNHELKFEVPSKMWFDLTDKSGKFGISVLEDCKYGSDKPDNNTLRLTLLYTPSAKLCPTWLYQSTQDWGIQDVKYGLYSHSGDWSQAETQDQAEFLNKPLVAVETPKHAGKLGRSFSFIGLSTPRVGLMALKKAEQGDYLWVRVNELAGKDQKGIKLQLPGKIMDAWEVNGQEQKIGEDVANGNLLTFDLSHYSLRSFAVKLATKNQVTFNQATVALNYDQDVMSFDNNRPITPQLVAELTARQALPAGAQPSTDLELDITEVAPIEIPPPIRPSSSRPDPILSADALFLRANEARRAGHDGRAIRLYRELQQRYPASREAQASRAMLGRLLLDRSESDAALSQFDGYLKDGGAGHVDEEVLVARAQSLMALGKRAEEKAAWESLLGRFPRSIHAARARQRLAELH